MNREELIEEAAKAILRADNEFDFNEGQSEDSHWLRALAEAALAVFEQAHTPTIPTDDEREYDRDMAVMLSQLVDDEPMWSCVVIAKKLHAAGFRRTVQGEPSDAQVLAALNTLNPRAATDSLDDWAKPNQDAMRAALRAAAAPSEDK